MLGVPLLREGTPIGVIALMTLHGPAVQRQADRTGHHFRRPGCDRNREHATARTSCGAHGDLTSPCSSRPPPPTCSRSSAARRAMWSRFSIRSLENAARLCDAEFGIVYQFDGRRFLHCIAAPRSYARSASRSTGATTRGRRAGTHCRGRGRSLELKIVHDTDVARTPITSSVAWRRRVAIAASSVFRCCADGRADRRHQHLHAHEARPVHRQADRAGEDLR